MLERTDRLALAVKDADQACKDYAEIFDSEIIDDKLDPITHSRRVTIHWGQDLIEFHEPTGPGPAAKFIEQGHTGIFAGGFTSSDPAIVAKRIEGSGATVHDQGHDRYIVLPEDAGGTGIIITKSETRPRVGLNDKIWQITYAAPKLKSAVDHYTDLLGLQGVFTNYYTSDLFGYDGAITWFDAKDGGLLDSLEYLEPVDIDKAVARFVKKNGTGIYMASIESPDIPAIKERVINTGDGSGWSGTEFGGFIHPKRLHGLLIGLVEYDHWNAKRPLPA